VPRTISRAFPGAVGGLRPAVLIGLLAQDAEGPRGFGHVG
jgi:hypothetical protein